MLLETIDNGSGAVSLNWFAGVLFSTVLMLILYVWNRQIKQSDKQLDEQKKQNEVLNSIAIDIAVMKSNSITTTNDVKHIRTEMEEVRREVGLIDKRVYKLEIAK
jgi:hypothetical protein